MFKLLQKIPRTVYIAFSGGVDSRAVLDFLSRNHNVMLAHVNHNNEIAPTELEFAQYCAERYNVPILIKDISPKVPVGKSKEQYWHEERYKFFHSLPIPVITCHHLDDAVETYVMNMMRGVDQTIPRTNKNVIRPFLTTRKQNFVDWCARKQLNYFVDPTNADAEYADRNYVRHNIIPAMLKVNPGLPTVVRKKIQNSSC